MKQILNNIKHLINKRKELKRLKLCLTVIIDAKNYYIRHSHSGMCNVFNRILFLHYYKYIEKTNCNNWIKNNIPEFNSKYLIGIKMSHDKFWWDITDVDSRIEAFDKLINLYKTKIKELC